MKKIELDWQKIGEELALSENVALVAGAYGLTEIELGRAYADWKNKPENCADLAQFMTMFKNQSVLSDLRTLKEAMLRGSKRAETVLKRLKSDDKGFDVETVKPRCCPASAFFEKGFSMNETELVLGVLPCNIKETCRKKCLNVMKFKIRDAQDEKIKEGNASLLQYFGTNILHQDTGGNEGFNPTSWKFVQTEEKT